MNDFNSSIILTETTSLEEALYIVPLEDYPASGFTKGKMYCLYLGGVEGSKIKEHHVINDHGRGATAILFIPHKLYK